MAVKDFALGPMGTNSYIMSNGKRACAIDVGGDPQPMLDYLRALGLTLDDILITHMHFDHLYGVAKLARETGATIYAPSGDAPLMGTEIAEGGVWGMPPVEAFKHVALTEKTASFAGETCEILSTPGHTPGGVSFYFPAQKCVFTGDALFARSIGRTDFPGGDTAQLLQAIRSQLFTLPPDTVVYPGHGSATTIGDEIRLNPFCNGQI